MTKRQAKIEAVRLGRQKYREQKELGKGYRVVAAIGANPFVVHAYLAYPDNGQLLPDQTPLATVQINEK